MKNLPKCKDCGKELKDYQSKRCWNCYCEFIKIPENNSNYKDGVSKKTDYKCKYGSFKERSESEIYRKNLSIALKGHTPWNKGLKGVQKSTRKGIRNKPKHYCLNCDKELAYNVPSLRCYSCAAIEKMKLIDFSGSNNPNYIDGRSIKWKEVRKQCFERDNYTCNMCNKRGSVYLNAHHIINRHICEDKYDINNLVTLCRECHLYITRIEMTERYIEYKEKFNLYIKKLTNEEEIHVGNPSVLGE